MTKVDTRQEAGWEHLLYGKAGAGNKQGAAMPSSPHLIESYGHNIGTTNDQG